MEVRIASEPPYTLIHLTGDVDLNSSPQARTAILEALTRNAALFVDLSQVTYMDSSGVASLVEGYQTARRQNLRFGLVAVAPPVRGVLRLARLDRVFPIHTTLAEAI